MEIGDRVNCPPVKINLRQRSTPVYNAPPFDTPFHLREAYDHELKDMLSAGILEPMGLRERDGCSEAFPVLKGEGHSVDLVSDFKNIDVSSVRHIPLTRQINC